MECDLLRDIYDASAKGDLPHLQRLISEWSPPKASPILLLSLTSSMEGEHGSPLHFAAMNNQLTVMTYLISVLLTNVNCQRRVREFFSPLLYLIAS